ncbi:MAG: hypothetical protein ACOX28_00950 [Bacilli bacterium]|jgi:hypothetical protein
MRDKLVKTNRKATYYRAKKASIAILFLLSIGLAVVIPIKIAESRGQVQRAHTTSEVITSESLN